jgi:uncharacterized membrane protein
MPATHLLLVLLICLAWAGNFLASANALLSLPPLLYTALRLAIVLLVLAPFLKAPAPGHWPRLLAVAVLNGSLHFAMNFWALRAAGDLSSVAIAMQSYVPMSVLLSMWLLGERVGWRSLTAVGVAFAGVLVMGLDPQVADQPLALLLCLLSAAALALGSTLMRGLEGVGVFSLQAWSALIGRRGWPGPAPPIRPWSPRSSATACISGWSAGTRCPPSRRTCCWPRCWRSSWACWCGATGPARACCWAAHWCCPACWRSPCAPSRGAGRHRRRPTRAPERTGRPGRPPQFLHARCDLGRDRVGHGRIPRPGPQGAPT